LRRCRSSFAGGGGYHWALAPTKGLFICIVWG
jgi:hypothetical protein